MPLNVMVLYYIYFHFSDFRQATKFCVEQAMLSELLNAEQK
jgi:hypothetical protein